MENKEVVEPQDPVPYYTGLGRLKTGHLFQENQSDQGRSAYRYHGQATNKFIHKYLTSSQEIKNASALVPIAIKGKPFYGK